MTIFDADNTETLQRYKDEIPKTLRDVLHGNTLNSGCGGWKIERNHHGITLSRPVAEWIIEKLEAASVRKLTK